MDMHRKYIYLLMVFWIDEVKKKQARAIQILFKRMIFPILDPTHPVYEPISPVIEGFAGQDVLIPCKPTSKLYSVKLVKEQDEVMRIVKKISHWTDNWFLDNNETLLWCIEGWRARIDQISMNENSHFFFSIFQGSY